MASTYDSLLRLELQATGENSNTWGEKTNNNIELIAQAVAGAVTIPVGGTGNYTLSTANAASDQARRMFLTFTGMLTGNRNIIIPSASKIYFINNQTSGAFSLTIKTATGTGAVVPQNSVAAVACDGTDCYLASTSDTSAISSLSANIAAVSALTSVNTASITSINSVIQTLSGATSADSATIVSLTNAIAAVSVQTSINTAAITSINAVIVAVSARTSVNAAAITVANAAITSVNSVVAAVSSRTSVNAAAITSINNVVAAVSARTSVNAAAITSTNNVVAAVSALTSVNAAAITSINAVVSSLAAMSSIDPAVFTSINNSIAAVSALTSVNAAAITSINIVLAAVSARTSVNAAAITSANAVIAAVSALTSTNAAAITSVNAVVSAANVWTRIAELSVSGGASVSVTWSSGAYSAIQIYVQGVRAAAATTSTDLCLRFYNDPALEPANYNSSGVYHAVSAGGGVTGYTLGAPTTVPRLMEGGVLNTVTYIQGQIEIFPGASGNPASFTGDFRYRNNAGSFVRAFLGADCNTTGAFSGLRIYYADGSSFGNGGKIVAVGLKV